MSRPALDINLLDAAVARLPEDELTAARRAALARFVASGFPTSAEEDWKYTNLEPAVAISNDGLGDAVATRPGKRDIAPPDLDAHWLVLHDGHVEASGVEALRAAEHAVRLQRLGDTSTADLLADDSLSAFNVALLEDGLRIEVADGESPAKPIALLLTGSSAKRLRQNRVLIDVGRDARLQLVEYHATADDDSGFTNSVIEANLADGAELDYVHIQQNGGEHVSVNRFHARLGRDATLRHAGFDFGGRMTRNDLVADIAHTGASVQLLGLYLAGGRQHIDNHTRVLHRVGPAHSDEEYRGILNGAARCVFNGKAQVFEGADGTDANQANHNLLLSERAEIDTKPELEIYADDVKCSHGATVGQLDADALFYLRARGLDAAEAQNILTRAFAAGTLARLPVDTVREHLEAAVDERLREILDTDDHA